MPLKLKLPKLLKSGSKKKRRLGTSGQVIVKAGAVKIKPTTPAISTVAAKPVVDDTKKPLVGTVNEYAYVFPGHEGKT